MPSSKQEQHSPDQTFFFLLSVLCVVLFVVCVVVKSEDLVQVDLVVKDIINDETADLVVKDTIKDETADLVIEETIKAR